LARLGATSAAASFPWTSSLLSGARGLSEQVSQMRLAADPLRPQFHLLPARNWMNDPDGPIYWNGQYHLFFQYNPNAAVWGDMHWAHAVSPDMIHWKHLPMALAPTPGGYDSEGCFSGSAVDDNGTPTFLFTGVKSVPLENATLRDGAHNFLETQCLAVSRDPQLLKWEKLGEPVLLPPHDLKLTGFRDPCLWCDGKIWYMGVGSGLRGEGGNVLLYRSADLRKWEYLQPLASGKKNDKVVSDPVDSAEMWECPDFFALGKKHLLLYSTERKVFWETGEYDSKNFAFHAERQGLLDNGAFYAPKSQLDARGRRILWGWIPETRPETEFSAAGWAGCMSLPRELAVGEDGELHMRVIPELQGLRGAELFFLPNHAAGAKARRESLAKLNLAGGAVELEVRFAPRPIHLNLKSGTNEFVSLGYDPARNGRELQVGKEFASLPGVAKSEHQLQIFLDGSVVECMMNGRAAWTLRSYVSPAPSLRLEVPETELGAITSLRAWPMRPISADRLTT
jgi:beta-fructofuranosidase